MAILVFSPFSGKKSANVRGGQIKIDKYKMKEYSFLLSYLVFEKDIGERMVKMGKKLLFKKE